ncbi:hypothetical protein HK405_012243, partial [Cladochytrium tenue]
MHNFLNDTNDIAAMLPTGSILPVQARNLLSSLLSRNPGDRKTARTVLSGAYLNSGQDTKESQSSLTSLKTDIASVAETVKTIAEDTRMLVQRQNEIRNMLFSLITEPNVPRIVALIPLGPAKWSQVNLYPLVDPRSFVRDLGPYLRAILQISSLAIGIGAAAVSGRGGGGGAAGVNPFANTGVRPTEYFMHMTALVDQVSESSASGSPGKPSVARLSPAAARELESLMIKLDPGRRLGGLQRCIDEDGN